MAAARLGLPATVHLYVLNSDYAGAWSWGDGSVFVSKPLVRLATQEELAAAIAHEMGHFAVARSGNPSAIAGRDSNFEIEAGADAAGMKILEQHGIARSTMKSLLRKLRGSCMVGDSVKPMLDQRLARLAFLDDRQ
jgi:predicted Zn-dependent protease